MAWPPRTLDYAGHTVTPRLDASELVLYSDWLRHPHLPAIDRDILIIISEIPPKDFVEGGDGRPLIVLYMHNLPVLLILDTLRIANSNLCSIRQADYDTALSLILSVTGGYGCRVLKLAASR